MSSDPPSSAAEPRRSTRKRSAATEADPDAVFHLDGDVSDTKKARKCSTLKRPSEQARSAGIRNTLGSKRPRRADDEKGGGCGCSRPVPEEGVDSPVKKNKKQLPDFIAATGIEKIRQAYIEKEDSKTLKQKQRESMKPKMGKMDIDYQVLHEAFFRYQTKPKLSSHGDLCYEGKEFEPCMLSRELKEALSMPDGAPPPWLVNMQRYGPPPSYPSLKIPGLNAPIPLGATFGYRPGEWGKPPVDEHGRPLYGDVFGVRQQDDPNYDEPVDRSKHWGDLEEEEEDKPMEDEDMEEGIQTVESMSSTPTHIKTPDAIDLPNQQRKEPEKHLYQVEEKEEIIAPGALYGSTQIFLKIGGSHFSMQRNLSRTTVKMLIEYGYNRMGSNAFDFYCIYAGKCLEDERFLSYYPIERNSTILLQHRFRAGVREQTIQCIDWDARILGVPRFHTVHLPPQFVDRTTRRAIAKFLSEEIQGYSSHVLIALCEIHIRGYCLDGNFGPEHILFYKGRAFFDNAILEILYSDAGGRRDYTRVHDIFEPVFRDENNRYPLHAENLLNFLFACPRPVNQRSPEVIRFLTNHAAVQSYTDRISTSQILDSMATRLFGQDLQRFRNIIHPVNWVPIQNVPALHTVLMYGAAWDEVLGQFVSTYGYDCRECALLGNNYLKHAHSNIHPEVVEAAFSLAMSDQDFMPKFLQRLATLDPPLQNPRFDVPKVFGKKLI